jgi:hypothetical protein
MLKEKKVYLFLALPLIGLACVLLGSGAGLTPSSKATQSQSQSPSQSQTLPQVEFPLPPDPVTVQVTLDEAQAVSSLSIPGVALGTHMQLTDANQVYYEVGLPDMMVLEAADGSITSAAGTKVTAIPIKSLTGLPFDGSLVAGIQFSPEGLQMVQPTKVSITLPGNYDPNELFVFAANGNGEEFHLYPASLILPPVGGDAQPTLSIAGMPTFPPEMATFMPPSNTITNGTLVMVDVMHFSLIGVITAAVVDIITQTDRPPTNSIDQAAQLLVDQLLESDVKDVVMGKEYDDTIKPLLLNADCGTAPSAAQKFLVWNNLVQTTGREKQFQARVTEGAQLLRAALKVCLENTCSLCMAQNDAGLTPRFVEYYYYFTELGNLIGAPSENATWIPLVNICAVKQGFKEPLPEMGSCGLDCPDAGPTPVSTCPNSTP